MSAEAVRLILAIAQLTNCVLLVVLILRQDTSINENQLLRKSMSRVGDSISGYLSREGASDDEPRQ